MIYERKSSWAVRVYRGNGEWKWVGSFPFADYGGKRAARSAAVKSEEAAKDSYRAPRGSRVETCDEFAARWPIDYPRPSAATLSTYRSALKPFIAHFAGVPLADIDRDTARRWAVGQPPSQINVLRSMFNDALEDDLVQRNPFEKMGRARKSNPQVGGKKQIWVPTVPELHTLAGLAVDVHGEEYGPTFAAYILFAAYSGMRPGELAVLEADCVDRKAGLIHVVRNLDGTGRVNDYTKNRRQRTVALLSGAAEALKSYPVQIDRKGDGGSPLLFTGPSGAVLGKGPRHNLWNPVRAAFGRPNMRLYSLRHFCATWLLERGASDLDVSVQLGHTDAGALVRSTYGHAERSSLDRLKALDSPQVAPLRDANEMHGGRESA